MYQKQGSIAEAKAAKALVADGFEILSNNWKVRSAEIDIVATKKSSTKWFRRPPPKELYFFEVKYRRDNAQGSGFEYITHTKLKQMRYSAELFASVATFECSTLHLGAIEVSGHLFENIEVLTDVSELLDL